MSISTFTLFACITGLGHSLFAAVALAYTTRLPYHTRLLHILLLCVCSSFLLCLLGIYQWPGKTFLPVQSTYILAFLSGPFTYLYLKKFLWPAVPLYRLARFWHLLPALLCGLYVFSVLPATWLPSHSQRMLFCLLGMCVVYGLACVRLVLQWKQQQAPGYTKNALYVVLLLSVVGVSGLTGIAVSLYESTHPVAYMALNPGWLGIPLLISLVWRFSFYFPEYIVVPHRYPEAVAEVPVGVAEVPPEAVVPVVATLPEPTVACADPEPQPTDPPEPIDDTKPKPAIRIPAHQVTFYTQQLHHIMLTEKPYLNPELSLQTLAGLLALSPSKLSWLINDQYGCNFYDYINGYRIQAFVQQLRKKAHHKQTLAALAAEVGFHSKTTFNKSFKRFLHCTPSQFIQQLTGESADNTPLVYPVMSPAA